MYKYELKNCDPLKFVPEFENGKQPNTKVTQVAEFLTFLEVLFHLQGSDVHAGFSLSSLSVFSM